MTESAPMAVIRPDRQLEVLDRERSPRWRTGPLPGLVWGQWGASSEPEGVLYSWPAWDPPGARLACFRTSPLGSGPELVVLHQGGVRTDVLLELPGRIPIYAQWSPDGGRIAVLYQEDQRLGLCAVHVDSGAVSDLCIGSPLFFTWADDRHLAVFVGPPDEAPRIGLVDAESGAFEGWPGIPGNFCAPVRVAGGIAYVLHHEGRPSIWHAAHGRTRRILELEGLVALLPDPTGQRLAVAIAPDDRSPYRDLRLLDPATGETRHVADRPITAFLWSPTGDRLVVASTDPRSGSVAFRVIPLDGGPERLLGEVRPSRDLRFYLRFFEQFAQSHPLIDPAGRALLVPGSLDLARNQRGLWRLDLDGSPPVSLGEGLLGVWGPVG